MVVSFTKNYNLCRRDRDIPFYGYCRSRSYEQNMRSGVSTGSTIRICYILHLFQFPGSGEGLVYQPKVLLVNQKFKLARGVCGDVWCGLW
jgi:hypothetical protein